MTKTRHKLGASQVSSVLGCGYDTPLQLACRMLGMIDDKPTSMAMSMGNDIESFILLQYATKTKRHLTANREKKTNDDYPWLAVTPDGFAWDDDHDWAGVVDAKNVGEHFRGDWRRRVPVMYQVQVQTQMAVCGVDWGSVVALCGGNELITRDLKRDDRFVHWMLRKTQDFCDMLDAGRLPDPIAKDCEWLTRAWEPTSGKEIDLPKDMQDVAEVRDLAAKIVSEYGSIKKLCDAKIKLAMKDAERMNLPSGGAFTFKLVELAGHVVKASSSRTLRRAKR